jgi:hypothetical protein
MPRFEKCLSHPFLAPPAAWAWINGATQYFDVASTSSHQTFTYLFVATVIHNHVDQSTKDYGSAHCEFHFVNADESDF